MVENEPLVAMNREVAVQTGGSKKSEEGAHPSKERITDVLRARGPRTCLLPVVAVDTVIPS